MQGKQAHAQGLPSTGNPYPPGTYEHDEWFNGWVAYGDT